MAVGEGEKMTPSYFLRSKWHVTLDDYKSLCGTVAHYFELQDGMHIDDEMCRLCHRGLSNRGLKIKYSTKEVKVKEQ